MALSHKEGGKGRPLDQFTKRTPDARVDGRGSTTPRPDSHTKRAGEFGEPQPAIVDYSRKATWFSGQPGIPESVRNSATGISVIRASGETVSVKPRRRKPIVSERVALEEHDEDGVVLSPAVSKGSEMGYVAVDALTVCERQSRAVIESMGAMGDLEEELIEEAGFHVERVSPVTYKAHARRAADAETWGE